MSEQLVIEKDQLNIFIEKFPDALAMALDKMKSDGANKHATDYIESALTSVKANTSGSQSRFPYLNTPCTRDSFLSDWLGVRKNTISAEMPIIPTSEIKDALKEAFDLAAARTLGVGASSPTAGALQDPIIIPLPDRYRELGDGNQSQLDHLYKEFSEKVRTAADTRFSDDSDNHLKTSISGCMTYLGNKLDNHMQGIPSKAAFEHLVDWALQQTNQYGRIIDYDDNKPLLAEVIKASWNEISKDAYQAAKELENNKQYPLQTKSTWREMDGAAHQAGELGLKMSKYGEWRYELLTDMDNQGIYSNFFEVEPKMKELAELHNTLDSVANPGDVMAQILSGTHIEWDGHLIENDMAALKELGSNPPAAPISEHKTETTCSPASTNHQQGNGGKSI